MPRHFRDEFKVEGKDLLIFDKKLEKGRREKFGPVEYLIAFNKYGDGQIFVRDCNDVDDAQGKDAQWQRYHQNLDAQARKEGRRQNHVRVEAHGDENVIWISSICDKYGTGEACPGYKCTCRTPEKVRPSLAKEADFA